MPPPAGMVDFSGREMVKLSKAAADFNLKGKTSNGKYGVDWYSERGGAKVGEGAWAAGDDTWMRPDLASNMENGAAGPSTPEAGPSGGPKAMPSSMSALGGSPAPSIESVGGGGLNPNLGRRIYPESMHAIAALGRRAY